MPGNYLERASRTGPAHLKFAARPTEVRLNFIRSPKSGLYVQAHFREQRPVIEPTRQSRALTRTLLSQNK